MKHDAIQCTITQARINNRIRTYLTLQGRDPELIAHFAKGTCDSYTTLATYGEYLETLPLDKNKPRDDWTWFLSTLKLLSQWDLNLASLTADNISQIERLIANLQYFQYARYKLLADREYYQIEDTKNRHLTPEYYLIGAFTAANLTRDIIFSGNTTSSILDEILKFDNRIIRIGAAGHVISLFRNKETVYLYNANYQFGRKIFTLDEKEAIAHSILKALPIARNTSVNMSIRVFTFDESRKNEYMPAKTIMDAISKLHSDEQQQVTKRGIRLFEKHRIKNHQIGRPLSRRHGR